MQCFLISEEGFNTPDPYSIAFDDVDKPLLFITFYYKSVNFAMLRLFKKIWGEDTFKKFCKNFKKSFKPYTNDLEFLNTFDNKVSNFEDENYRDLYKDTMTFEIQAGKNSVHQQLGRLSTSTIFNIEKVSLRTSTIFNIEKGESSYTASNMVGQKYIICDTLLTDYVTNNFHM